MRHKGSLFWLCCLLLVQLTAISASLKQYDENLTLKKKADTYVRLLNSANNIIAKQKADLLAYKNQTLYYQNKMVLLDRYIQKEKLVISAKTKTVLHTISFDPNDIRIPSGATAEDLALALKGTKLEHLAPAYVALEQKYGWNAISAVSITAHETYWGNDYKVTEYNNLGGIRERSGDYWIFNSQEECVDYIGSLISRKYLNPNGEYFNGYSLKAINAMYCPVGGDTWSSSITQIGDSLVAKIQDGS